MNHPAPCPVANTGQLGKRWLGLPEAGLNFPPPSSKEVRSTCALRKPRSRERNGRGVKRGSVVRVRKESPARKRYHVPASMAAGRGVRRSAALGRWIHPCGEKNGEKLKRRLTKILWAGEKKGGKSNKRIKNQDAKHGPNYENMSKRNKRKCHSLNSTHVKKKRDAGDRSSMPKKYGRTTPPYIRDNGYFRI